MSGQPNVTVFPGEARSPRDYFHLESGPLDPG